MWFYVLTFGFENSYYQNGDSNNIFIGAALNPYVNLNFYFQYSSC